MVAATTRAAIIAEFTGIGRDEDLAKVTAAVNAGDHLTATLLFV